MGTNEILIISIVLFILFGARTLPFIGRSLGESVKELRKAIQSDSDEEE